MLPFWVCLPPQLLKSTFRAQLKFHPLHAYIYSCVLFFIQQVFMECVLCAQCSVLCAQCNVVDMDTKRHAPCPQGACCLWGRQMRSNQPVLIVMNSASQSAEAVIAKYLRLGGLNNRPSFLTDLEAGKSKTGCWQIQFLVKAHVLDILLGPHIAVSELWYLFPFL